MSEHDVKGLDALGWARELRSHVPEAVHLCGDEADALADLLEARDAEIVALQARLHQALENLPELAALQAQLAEAKTMTLLAGQRMIQTARWLSLVWRPRKPNGYDSSETGGRLNS